MSAELNAAVRAALGKVVDPELRRPITEVGMVKDVTVESDGAVHVEIYLTTSACPKKTEITDRVTDDALDPERAQCPCDRVARSPRHDGAFVRPAGPTQ